MLSLYIVCHRVTCPENHADFTEEEATEEGLVWYVVNEALPEKSIQCFPSRRVNEWELAVHDPFMQLNHFYNNSALWHVFRNPLLRRTAFVGFAQYDMAIPKRALRAFAGVPGATRVGIMFPYPFCALWENPLPREYWEGVVREAQPGVGLGDLSECALPLMHGFILPTPAFMEMMAFADCALAGVVRALGHDTRHLAGTLERLFALWIAAKVHAGRLGPMVTLEGCAHNQETQRLPDAFREL